MQSNGMRASGFTLIELLVVITIIGILMSLLLPAVNRIRETARQTQCMNNLRQIAMAVINFETGRRHIPHSYDWTGPSQRGWITEILPQLEQQPLFDQFKLLEFNLRHEDAHFVREAQLETLMCPSDGISERIITTQNQFSGTRMAVTNYKGVIGDPNMGNGWPGMGSADRHNTSPNNGMFWRFSFRDPVTMAHIRDGVSNTLMLGEDVPAHNQHSAWAYSNGDYSSCHAPVNFLPLQPTPSNWPRVMGFRSLHVGIVQFCTADASVKRIVEGVDHASYRAACTKDGGETLPMPF